MVSSAGSSCSYECQRAERRRRQPCASSSAARRRRHHLPCSSSRPHFLLSNTKSKRKRLVFRLPHDCVSKPFYRFFTSTSQLLVASIDGLRVPGERGASLCACSTTEHSTVTLWTDGLRLCKRSSCSSSCSTSCTLRTCSGAATLSLESTGALAAHEAMAVQLIANCVCVNSIRFNRIGSAGQYGVSAELTVLKKNVSIFE